MFLKFRCYFAEFTGFLPWFCMYSLQVFPPDTFKCGCICVPVLSAAVQMSKCQILVLGILEAHEQWEIGVIFHTEDVAVIFFM